MINKLKAKLKNQGGFTMVELLIVVAIIAILVAVSIPMVNASLEKARRAVDEANARDAITLASVEVMTEGINTDTWWTYEVSDGRVGSLGTAATAEPNSGGVEGKSKDLVGTGLWVKYDSTNDDFETSYDTVLYPTTP